MALGHRHGDIPNHLVVDFFVGVQVPPAVTLQQPVTGGRWQYIQERPALVVVVVLLVGELNVVCETVLEVVEVDVPVEVASALVVEVADLAMVLVALLVLVVFVVLLVVVTVALLVLPVLEVPAHTRKDWIVVSSYISAAVGSMAKIRKVALKI
jgi:hypothetical protein